MGLRKSHKGNLPCDKDTFDAIYANWLKRSWKSWLRDHLKFPFTVKRGEDDDDAYYTDIVKSEPFRLDHVMEFIDIEMEDDLYGIIMKVREGRKFGHVPFCDVEITSKEDENFWPVREYVVWFANR